MIQSIGTQMEFSLSLFYEHICFSYYENAFTIVFELEFEFINFENFGKFIKFVVLKLYFLLSGMIKNVRDNFKLRNACRNRPTIV